MNSLSMPTRRVLVIVAHPAQHASRANAALAMAARALPFATVHRLYASYPNFFIDTRREQNLLLDHDVIVLQHPFYWYSVPALLKEWIDLVLEHGWAYGEGGRKLVGKTWTHAITTGGPRESYQPQGINRYTIEDFMRPLEQTAYLCGMQWVSPFVSHSARRRPDDDLRAEAHRYAEWLRGLAAKESSV